ncbi:MAG: hypothetical protein RIS70_3439 [Planctomycetota bacterium]
MPQEASRGSDMNARYQVAREMLARDSIVRHPQRRWQSGPALLPVGMRSDDAPCLRDAPQWWHVVFEPTGLRKAAVQDRTAWRGGKKRTPRVITRGVRGLNGRPRLRTIRYGSRSPRTFGNSPVSAFMNSTKSLRSCSFKPIFLIFVLSCGFGCPPLSYHSTTSSSVFWLPSCM